ncbi:MAG: hypothetical protein V4474_01550 [Patescibacteria group bacterium]
MKRHHSAPVLAIGALLFLSLAIWSYIFAPGPLPATLSVQDIEPQWFADALKVEQTSTDKVAALFAALPPDAALPARTKTSGCIINGSYPDTACTPGEVFKDAATSTICVSGYTKTVRSVSTKLRQQIYRAYDIAYPPPTGTYELDHFIPLALAGDNSAANLFPEAAAPKPGFREKDVVEVYLYEEVCKGHIDLQQAQVQIATDWLAVYNALQPADIARLKQKYSSWSN